MAKERPINRRMFFRHGLSEMLKPLIKSAEPLRRVAKQFEDLERQSSPPPYTPPPADPMTPVSLPVYVRPPGALPEEEFKSTCSRCGECVRVCPATAIRIDYSYEVGQGMPYIDVDAQPCVMCDGLVCMHHCPSGALRPVEQVKMGTAIWNDMHCVRTHGDVSCTTCVDKCPAGSKALQLTDHGILVIEEGCTGCGVCQNNCPTTPKAITVQPAHPVTCNVSY